MMYKFALGINFEKKIDIKEGFSIKEDIIYINLSLDKFSDFFERILDVIIYPAFFVLHCPTPKSGETVDGELHEDIYYMDNCDKDCIREILFTYFEILFNDGLIKFGVGSHISNDEIFVDCYKTIYIFAKEMSNYKALLLDTGLSKYTDIKTAKDFISQECICKREIFTLNQIDIYDIIKNLRQNGMYYEKTIKTGL